MLGKTLQPKAGDSDGAEIHDPISMWINSNADIRMSSKEHGSMAVDLPGTGRSRDWAIALAVNGM